MTSSHAKSNSGDSRGSRRIVVGRTRARGRTGLQRCFAKIGTAALLGGWVVVSVNCEVVMPRHGWNEEWGPRVPHDTFPYDCNLCHETDRWDTLRQDFSFDHGKETGRPLQGAHQDAACLRCHNDRGPVQMYLSRGCGGCHVDPHKSVMGFDCEKCHNQENWEPLGFVSEHSRSRFPLVGVHSVTPCESCHLRAQTGDFRGTPIACELCHQRELLGATSPDHTFAGWVNNCQRCHAPLNWAANFDHGFFPLIGGHALNCINCHPNGRVGPLDPTCFACHQNDYLNALNHVALGYSTDCTLCHNIYAWK